MRLTRLPATGIVAASVVALALVGCPGPTDPPVTASSKKPRASASPKPGTPVPTLTPGGTTPPPASATPSAGSPTPVASGTPASPSASPSGSASPVGPPPSGKTLTLTGRIYDDEGAAVGGATVTATSLDTRAAFTGSATADGEGRYTLAGVPEGANVAVSATKASFTTRTRVGAYEASRENATDFGVASGGSGAAAAFFLVARPEIDRIEPDAALLAKGQLGVALVLSSPLDAANQARFLAQLRVWPANEAAAPRGDANTADDEDLSKQPDTGSNLPEPVIETDLTADGYVVDYAIKDQAPFLAGAVKASGTWNAEGTRLAFTFPVPLVRGKKEARYQVGLVRGAEAVKIEDTAGHALGGNRFGDLGVLPGFAGNLLRNVFRAELPTIKDEDGDGTITKADKWNATHETTRTFTIPKDDTPPKLEAVRVKPDVEGSFRLELQFDEPIVAYNGTRDGEAAKTFDGDDDRDGDVDLADFVRNYTFVLGDAAGSTATAVLDGWESSQDLALDPRGVSSFGADAATRGRELCFDVTTPAFRKRLDEATTGQLVVDVDEADPRVVRLTIKGRPNFLAPAVKELKVRVTGLADPAGNAIGRTQADRDVKTVAL